jgi:phage-related protein
MDTTQDKPVVWLHGEIKTPPFSPAARVEAGILLRKLQRGEVLAMPHSRPMPAVGPGCHELRIVDQDNNWRIIYHMSDDAVLILDVFSKKTGKIPKRIIEICRRRLRHFGRVT